LLAVLLSVKQTCSYNQSFSDSRWSTNLRKRKICSFVIIY